MSYRVVKKWIPLVCLLLLLALALYFHLYRFLSFDMLRSYHQQLLFWTQQHYWLAVLGFMAIYIVAVAISIPGATLLTLMGGFLFGIVMGTVYVACSATMGATIVFLSVRTAFGAWLAQRATGWMAKLEQGFQRNAFNYLLTLRLMPIFPFWLVNIVPALLNVSLRTFIIASFLGMLPGVVVYITIGHGLSQLFASGQTPNLGIIFTPSILLPLIGLGILSLLPTIHRWWQHRGKHE